MRRLAAYLAAGLLAFAMPAAAQDEAEADKGFLTRYLEENLSGIGRDVQINGFDGALSSRATIEEMTFADDQGVWLTIRDAAISWNRSALLRGQVEIDELSAGSIDVARMPVAPDEGLPEPEARVFRLPDLPVSVEIGILRAGQVSLGETILGEPVAVSLEGGLTLAGGEGSAKLDVQRIDGTEGQLSLDASFANETRVLDIALSLEEPQDGIAVRLLNIPGRPAIGLSVDGTGALSDFEAEIALYSDGEPRLAGTARLTEAQRPEDAPRDGPVPAPARQFSLNLGGDIAPLFLPQYRDFFGPDVRLLAVGTTVAGGRTELSELSVEAAALKLDGNLVLAADGLPESFALDARIAAADGEPVLLPTTGEPTFVDSAELRLTFDATKGDSWTGAGLVAGLEVAGNAVEKIALTAEGEIARGKEGAGRRSVTARLGLEAAGIDPASEEVAQAVGPRLDARATVGWVEGEPVQLSKTVVQTEHARATFDGALGSVGDALPLTLRGVLNLEDLSVYSALAGREIGGRVVLGLNGTANLLDGRFDIRAGGAGRDLTSGIAMLDRAIAGAARLGVDVRRDETGVLLRRFALSTAETDIAAAGILRSGESDVTARARLAEVGRVVPQLSGAASIEARLRETAPDVYAVTAVGTGPGGTDLSFEGELREDARGQVTADGALEVEVARLAAFAELAGMPLRGSLAATVTGEAALSDDRFDVALDLTGRDLATGIASLDRLLRGQTTLTASAVRQGDVTEVENVALRTPELTADLTATLGRSDGRIEGTARLRDLGLFAPDFPGPLDVEGRLDRTAAGDWATDIRARGPGNTVADVSGTIAGNGASVDLAITGEAPLGIANEALAPQAISGRAAFDLRMQGRPGPAALSGTIGTSGARLAAPAWGTAIGGLGGTVTLAGGQATLDLSGAIDGGGQVTARGSVGLDAPNDANLRIGLRGAQFSDPELFKTTVNGEITVTGPLQGGGLVGGVLQLGETNIRIAETGAGTGDDLPGLRHVNEPAAVQRTRVRAGFAGGEGGGGADAGAGGGARPLRLALRVVAPNRIFVRGRGLDAELGGTLTLGGTTSDVVPQGQFDLIRGRLDILGRRLVLDEGSARLEGSFEPYIRLVAVSEAGDVTVRIVVEGPASEPEIRFESEPPLPEDEVLAQLFFGRNLSDLSPLQAAQLASAVASLAGQGGTDLVGGLRESFGLDDLDITTDAEGNAAVRAGRYISDNVYTDVTIGAEGEANVSINLDLSKSVTVKGSVGTDGETGIGIFYEKDY